MIDKDMISLDEIARSGIRPVANLTVSEWADAHRVLGDMSAEPGPWRTSRVPYLREVMDCLSANNPIERIVMMAGAQVGKTEAGLNWIGYAIAHTPGMMLMVMPTESMVKRNTTVRIDPMIASTPILRKLVVSAGRRREAGNTMMRKSFPGGQLVMIGSNSSSALRSTSVRYLMMDEVDAYPGIVGDDGDPVMLAVERTATFQGQKKIYLCSTPTVKDHSRIEKAYLESDQRKFFVPCPSCGHFAPITWSRIVWPEGRPLEAGCACAECGAVAPEAAKARMVAEGKWVATASGDGHTAGFHISTLYSPFHEWGLVAKEHQQVMRDPSRLRVWVNNKLGETWEDDSGESINPDPLMARREDWDEMLPAPISILTAGVDVQGDRIEVQVVGWGADEESWVVDYMVLYGDPSGPQLWRHLDDALAKTYRHSNSVPDLPISAICIDTGGAHTKATYEYCRTRFHRPVWAIKGRQGHLPVWPKRPTKVARGQVALFICGVDTAKDSIAARLRLTEAGPGMIHFGKALDVEYFRQLTSEKVITRHERGIAIRCWVPKREHDPNEALDTMVYALAALQGRLTQGYRLNLESGRVAATSKREKAAASVPAPRPGRTRVRSTGVNLED